MNLEQVLDKIRASRKFMDCATEWHEIPPREARLEEFPDWLDERLVHVMRARGIDKLYTHQHTSLERLNNGENIVIVTPTASGKTLCYNPPPRPPVNE